jgi:hypothetical protein
VRATAGAAARPTPHGDLRGGGGGDGGRVQSARGGAAGGRDPRGPVGRRTELHRSGTRTGRSASPCTVAKPEAEAAESNSGIDDCDDGRDDGDGDALI